MDTEVKKMNKEVEFRDHLASKKIKWNSKRNTVVGRVTWANDWFNDMCNGMCK